MRVASRRLCDGAPSATLPKRKVNTSIKNENLRAFSFSYSMQRTDGWRSRPETNFSRWCRHRTKRKTIKTLALPCLSSLSLPSLLTPLAPSTPLPPRPLAAKRPYTIDTKKVCSTKQTGLANFFDEVGGRGKASSCLRGQQPIPMRAARHGTPGHFPYRTGLRQKEQNQTTPRQRRTRTRKKPTV